MLDALEVAPEERTRALAEAAPRGARDALAHAPIGSPVHLGQVLRALRQRARLTQSRAASRLGATQAAVAHWEAGTRVPDGETLNRLLAVLGTRSEDAAWARGLVEREPPRPKKPARREGVAGREPASDARSGRGSVARLRARGLASGGAPPPPPWEVVLAETMSWRSLAHAYAGDPEAQDGAARAALILVASHDAWGEVFVATALDLDARLVRRAISTREYDRRQEEAFGRLRDENARLCVLHDWVGGMGHLHLGRAEVLLDRMRRIATRDASSRPQEISWSDIWLIAARCGLRRGDPEAALEALGHVSSLEGDVSYETLRTKARHLVEPSRPTGMIVERAYTRPLRRGSAMHGSAPPASSACPCHTEP